MNYEKPPIGLKPKWLADIERLRDVQGAIARYYEAEMVIPVEWVSEYNTLLVTTHKHRKEASE